LDQEKGITSNFLVFNLLGYFSPIVLDAKLFMKILWVDKCEWDVTLNKKQLEMWLQVIKALRDIPTFHLPRYIGITHEGADSIRYNFVCFLMLQQKCMPQLFTFIKHFQTFAK